MKPSKRLIHCALIVLLTPCFAQELLTKVTEGDDVNDPGYSYLPSWGDYDGDGWLDLFIANGGNEGPAVPFLYHNNRDGTFTRMTINEVGALADDPVQAAQGNWADYDKDGDLDLVITRGQGSGDPCLLFNNQGDGTFASVACGSLTEERGHFTGCALADYDNDGALDLIVTTVANEVNALFHNDGNGNGWLMVRLLGTVSNRDAVGAKVRASATIRGQSIQQMRQIGGGSLGDPRAHFGLGDANNVTTLRIEWPSGIVQELTNVATKQILTIAEPAQLVPLEPREFQIRCWKGMKSEVEKSPDLQTWDSLGVVTNETGTLVFQDTQGDPHTAACFYRVVSR